MATTILTGTSVVFPDGTTDTTAQAEKGVLLNISAYGPGTYTWTAPAGTTNVWVRLIGGGGGSGSADGINFYTGGTGGSGIVIISYINPTQRATGGTVTNYVSGSSTYWVHTFTTSGTFTA